MQAFRVTSQRRAELYHWFTALFAAPLSEDDLNEFGGYDMHRFLDSLATLDPLTESTEAFRREAEKALQQPAPQQHLAHDYQTLTTSPALLNTLHLSEATQDNLLLMSMLLTQHGTCLADDDPLHVCNQLEMMGTLAMASASAGDDAQRALLIDQQRELANTLLIDWLPVFSVRCRERDTNGFYAAAAQLLLAVFMMDLHYLNNVAE
ncbi:molecular chaperone TorD family protein [Oceanimonas baumannii]|uniref:Chaperone protein TorD n=1 Tax=Oceanimonas baumannii TaxID=129578 RepID=A0A235CDJ8_9GAMM|nr:molecular chaperone TorD family protein [Oceanimonas baumannii]OYD22612.1 chaperone protein TorD [Oceanimonas baumannii]TDW57632.1 TorA-specific chaperone [Oceanimonas baumannii]